MSDWFKTVDGNVIVYNPNIAPENREFQDIDFDNLIKPENYIGTDFQKLQQAFNDSIIQKKSLCLSRTYDIQNGTIIINKGAEGLEDRTPTFVFGGGTIKKAVNGYIFSGTHSAISDLFFNNIYFLGDVTKQVKVFNCDYLMRINTNNCYFKNIHTVFYAVNNVQSIKMHQDTCFNIINGVFDCGGAYDVLCNAILFEESDGTFYADKSSGTIPELYNVRFTNCCIEGSRSLNPVLYFKNCETLTIQNCYFEKNKGGNIDFDANASLRNVSIENCTLFGTTDNQPLIKWGGNCLNCHGINNYSMNEIVNDFTKVLDNGYRVIIKNHYYYYNSMINKDINANKNIVYYEDINNILEVKDQTNKNISVDLFKSFLIVNETGSTTIFKDNYLALYNSDLVMSGLSLAARGSDFVNSPPTTVLMDKSGMNNTGTVVGFLHTSVSGADGLGAIVFSDVQNNGIIFPILDYDEMTIEYVCTLLALPVTSIEFLDCLDTTTGYSLGMLSDNTLIFKIRNSIQVVLVGATELIVNTKYVIQVRFSTIRKSMDITINSIMDTKLAQTLNSTCIKNLASVVLRLGKDSNNNSINHKLHALNIYNRYLTDDELLNNYNVLS